MTTLEVMHDLGRPEPFVADYDTREGVTARRNVLIGLWAAGRLGLTGSHAEAYAWSVHLADQGEPGHDDVVAKISADFASAGATVRERSIRRNLREMESRAFLQLTVEPHFCRPQSR